MMLVTNVNFHLKRVVNCITPVKIVKRLVKGRGAGIYVGAEEMIAGIVVRNATVFVVNMFILYMKSQYIIQMTNTSICSSFRYYANIF